MNSFLLSCFWGIIVEMELIAAYFGWHLVKTTKLIGRITGLFLAFVAYFLAVNMSFWVVSQLGVVNVSLIKVLLLVPILISSVASMIMLQFKKQ